MDEKRCEMIPMFRYTWPGRNEEFACLPHAAQLRGIANALGMHFQLIPLSPEEMEGKQCAQNVKIKNERSKNG